MLLQGIHDESNLATGPINSAVTFHSKFQQQTSKSDFFFQRKHADIVKFFLIRINIDKYTVVLKVISISGVDIDVTLSTMCGLLPSSWGNI